MAVHPVASTRTVAVLHMASPGELLGETYIVSTGDWSGQVDALAMMGERGWVFLAPFEALEALGRVAPD